MPLLPTPNLDYTDRDFNSLLRRLRGLISTVFPKWTDDQVANFGNILVELFAFVGDVLTFYQDNQAGESRMVTATQRKNLLALAKLVNYEPPTASAATVDETFTLSAPAVGTVTLPAGTQVKTREVTNSLAFQLLVPLVFSPGETTKTATVEHSEFQQSIFASTGVAGQAFVLTSTPYLDGSARVADALGSAYDASTNPSGWREVSTFLDSGPTSKHFTVTVDQDDRATLQFGNGINGVIPSGNITVDYKTGGGSAGRVEEAQLTRLEGSFTDSVTGGLVSISVTNAVASSGGADRVTNAQIVAQAPASLRVLRRAVAREDYELAALQVPGVARALMLTADELSSALENVGTLFLVPVGGGAPSQALLDAVSAQFAVTGPYPKTVTFQVTPQVAAYRTVDVSVIVFARAGYAAATVKANVLRALTSFFAIQNADGTPNTNIDFGYYFQDLDGAPTGELAWSDVFNVVRDTPGVRKVDEGAAGLLINGVRADLVLQLQEFPVLGAVTIVDGSTGLPIP